MEQKMQRIQQQELPFNKKLASDTWQRQDREMGNSAPTEFTFCFMFILLFLLS